jgi:hypothetical protein
MKTATNGRWPQNMKSGISQQPLAGSYSNFILKQDKTECTKVSNEDDLQRKTTSNGRPQIWKVEYTSNHWLKLNQIWNLSYWDHTRVDEGIKWTQPPTKDLKIWKVEYLSNHGSDLTQIWNLSCWDQTRVYKGITYRWPQQKRTSKYDKSNIRSY